MQREIVLHPAYDKRHSDPHKNYGIHGVDMRWHLKGELGVVQFVVYTNWHLPHVQEEFDAEVPAKGDSPHLRYLFHKPQPADVGYHSPKPRYEGQEPLQESCQLLDGVPCYYDGSGVHAQEMFERLLTGGSEAVWAALEAYYTRTFGDLR